MTTTPTRFRLTPEKDRDYTTRAKNTRWPMWLWLDAQRKAHAQGRPLSKVLVRLLEGWVRGDIDV